MAVFSVEEKVQCLERELLRRRKTYPSAILRHRVSTKLAAREIELLSQILDDYLAIEASQQLPGIIRDAVTPR